MSATATTGDSEPEELELLEPISDESRLYRRVPKNQVVFEKNDDGTSRVRPSSACFTDNNSSMSLFDEETCGGIDAVMSGHEDFFLVSLKASELRSLGLYLHRTKSGGPGHCEAVGKKTGSIRSRLAKMALWVIAPSEIQS